VILVISYGCGECLLSICGDLAYHCMCSIQFIDIIPIKHRPTSIKSIRVVQQKYHRSKVGLEDYIYHKKSFRTSSTRRGLVLALKLERYNLKVNIKLELFLMQLDYYSNYRITLTT
jgi:hypothetical protein